MSIGGFGQFVEISKPNIYLSLYRGFLEVYEKNRRLDRVPLDDILGVIITGYGCSHSSNILSALAEKGIPVSICGSNFLPKAVVLPVVGNCRQNLRMRAQAQISKPFRKQVWRKIVQLKLQNQAHVLRENKLAYEWLLNMSKRVRSGDPDNFEAQGARRYWISLFSKQFKRNKEGDGINGLLNYGYAIVRSCVARGIVAAGLHPSLGIYHHNTYNPMCLVDDLMEPFRPLVDYVVKQLVSEGFFTVDKRSKEILSKIAVVNVLTESGINPLFQVIAHFSTSLAMVLSAEKKEWLSEWKVQWDHFNLDSLNTEITKSSA